MKKTGFKTFVCSFVFSLFIIFAINGLFFYSPEKSPEKLRIPKKNIALFFSRAQNSPLSAQVKPIKKIALSLPAAKPSRSAAVSRTMPDLKSDKPEPSEKNGRKIPDSRDVIPLEITEGAILYDGGNLVAASIEAKEPPLNSIRSITDPENNKDQGGWDTGNDDYTTEQQNHDNNKPVKTAENTVQPAPLKAVDIITDNDNYAGGDYDSGNNDYSLEAVRHEPKPLLLAGIENKAPPQKAVNAITDSDNDTGGDYDTSNDDYSGEQNLLIPLQKDFADTDDNNNFKIAKTADSNQVAMVSGNTPLGSMIKEKEDIGSGIIRREPDPEENSQPKDENWKSMAEKENNDSPWVAAKGTKFPKNNSVLESDYYKSADGREIHAELNTEQQTEVNINNIKLASDMVQNILIPIPDDILNDDNLVPQLESSKKDRQLEEEVTRREQEKNAEFTAAQQLKAEISKNESVSLPDKAKSGTKSGGLFKSITSIFSGSPAESNDIKEAGVAESGNSFLDRIAGRVGKAAKGNAPTKILPAEMRLAFQPNRAEISGSTLKWIQAFANKVNSDRSVILEIRIDGSSSYALQQKRLNLLHNILTNKGVDYSKINTVFTTREPNSFIIRTVRINSNIDRDVKESREQAAYYQSW